MIFFRIKLTDFGI